MWRGGKGQHRLAHFIESCEVEPFGERFARTSGTLLAAAAHGVVDASVVECALRRASPCVTGNRSHLTELAGTHRLNLIDV